jgi:sugar lactone lactonase YvrE
MHPRFRPILVALLSVLAVASYVLAGLPTFWTLEGQPDFLTGEVDGLSIASDGVISLAPATRNLYESTDPFFWSLVSDRKGNLYAGSGNDGRVYKIDSTGAATVLVDTHELEVHGLAVDRRGDLFAATSPRGHVYKISPDGDQDVFFDPDDRYIWALAFDQIGNLLVATGDKGNLYRVSPSGESEVLFASQETHLMCLTTDSEGNIYAGSDSNGLVFKIDDSDRVSVLFDTPFREVRALVVDTRGNVFAATINDERRPTAPAPVIPPATPPAPPPQTVVPPSEGVTESVTVTVSATAMPAAVTPAVGGLRGAVYRISPEGSAERLWGSPEDLPLSLKLERDDRLMVGTGKKGRIFLVRQDKTSSLLLRAEADQVTSIYSGDGRTVFFSTSNPAKIYQFGTGRRSEGEYRSPIKDTETVSSWGRVRWESRAPAGTGLTVQTRTGNSAKPDNTWSDWSAPYTVSDGEQIASPKGRFLQWRAILKTSDSGATPELLKLTAVYLQQNLSPEVTEITLHPPGQTFQKPLVTTGEIEILGLNAPLDVQGTLDTGNPAGTPNPFGVSNLPLTAYSRSFYKKGYQTVIWSATDPNDDTLSFNVLYRAEGQSLWKPLRKNLREAVIAWDTVAMPDGRYTLKIVASDAPSNPQASFLTGERESKPFDVDNTPPRLADLNVSRTGAGHRLTFVALDDSSAVRKVEYAVDSGRWVIVYPEDGICDSKREEFDVTVGGYTQGVHTLVLKVTDLLGNVVTARAELR